MKACIDNKQSMKMKTKRNKERDSTQFKKQRVDDVAVPRYGNHGARADQIVRPDMQLPASEEGDIGRFHAAEPLATVPRAGRNTSVAPVISPVDIRAATERRRRREALQQREEADCVLTERFNEAVGAEYDMLSLADSAWIKVFLDAEPEAREELFPRTHEKVKTFVLCEREGSQSGLRVFADGKWERFRKLT